MNNKNIKKEKLTAGSLLINIFMTILFASAGIVFSVLSVKQFESGFLHRYRVLCLTFLIVLIAIMTILSLIFYFRQKETAYKLTITVFLLADLILIFFYCLLATGFLKIVHDVESFQEYIASAGVWMDALFIALQYLQVVILPIPSFVTLAAGTALFGPVRCFLYSYASIVLGSLTAFFIGRLLGYKAVAWLVGKDTLDTWLKKVKGKDYVILTAMFVLPFFPDDLLCFVAGLSTITAKYFTFMILFCRALAIATTCFSIGFIPFNTWWGILSWIVIGIVVLLAFILFYKNQEKIHAWFEKLKKRKENDKKND